MKYHTHTFLLLLVSSQSIYGAFYYADLGTEETSVGSGVYQFINPGSTGWSGNGAIAGPTGSGLADPGGTGSLTAVDNFTGSGVLSMGQVYGWGTTIIAGTTAQMTVSLVGTGSADISFNHGTGGPTVGHPLGMHIRDFQGDVTEFTVEFNFSDPVAPTATSAANNQPYLAGIDSNAPHNRYNFDADYLGLMHTTDGLTMLQGMPANFESIDMNGNTTDWADNSTAITAATITNGAWRGLNTFDIDNDGIHDTRSVNGIVEDGEDVYATGIRFTVRRNDGQSLSTAGADVARFLFSTNGTVHPDTVALAEAGPSIPEPSSLILFGLGTLALARRKRA